MTSRTKWLESLDLKEISRAAIADPDFKTPEFLMEYSDFRTLKDMQQLVGSWERKLESELSDTVNMRFADFVEAVSATARGEQPLASVKEHLSKFSEQAEALKREVSNYESQISAELTTHRALSIEEVRARKLLRLFDLLAELEAAVPETAIDSPQLVVLARLYVALTHIAQDLKSAKAISVLRVSIESVHKELLQKLDKSRGNLDILVAREFVLASSLPNEV